MTLYMILKLLVGFTHDQRQAELLNLGVDEALWSHIHSSYDPEGQLYELEDRERMFTEEGSSSNDGT
jgi:hypothetical protein